ncbi:hypothetical protein [Streptomyces clavifer]|uniref:hypothetical protein n=1 Tax=Streptomyces clavifer TaxID=68188 RepID=UPI0038068CC8
MTRSGWGGVVLPAADELNRNLARRGAEGRVRDACVPYRNRTLLTTLRRSRGSKHT